MHEEEWSGEPRGRTATLTDPPTLFTNVADLVRHQAAAQPDATALVRPAPERRSLTWSELEQRVAAVASGLAAHGLVAGHRVALRGPSSIEFVVAYFATLRAGFVCVPLDPEAAPDELRSTLADCGARVLLSTDPVEVDDLTPDGVRVLALTEGGLAELAADGATPVLSPPDREALAVLLYTAGTSGEPKAAMLSHRALLAHLEHLHGFGIVDETTVVLALLPLFHVFGLNAVLGSWVRGGGRLVVEESAEDLVDVIVDEQVTNLPLAPSVLYRLLQHAELAASLAGVRTVVSGAAPLPPALGHAFTERTGLRLEQGYGLTEAAPGVTVTLGGDLLGAGHVGRPLPGVDVRIGDGTDQTEPAEIWIRGDNLFSGYWPDGRGGPDADGWFATGDIGYLTDGELFLVDRSREVINVQGFSVYPAEVEDVIRSVPGVEAVAVIGRRSAGAGEQVVAFVAGTGLTAEQVVEHCVAGLARFKRPADVYLVDELPRGATGKVKKGVLRRLMASAELEERP